MQSFSCVNPISIPSCKPRVSPSLDVQGVLRLSRNPFLSLLMCPPVMGSSCGLDILRAGNLQRRNRVFQAHEVMNALYTGLDAVLDDVARFTDVGGTALPGG